MLLTPIADYSWDYNAAKRVQQQTLTHADSGQGGEVTYSCDPQGQS